MIPAAKPSSPRKVMRSTGAPSGISPNDARSMRALPMDIMAGTRRSEMELLQRRSSAPSPRLRGEGWGEEGSQKTELVESPPHPALRADLSPHGGRGEES